MHRRLFQTLRHSSHRLVCSDWPVPWKLCIMSSICALFLTLALMRRAPQTPCIKSLLRSYEAGSTVLSTRPNHCCVHGFVQREGMLGPQGGVTVGAQPSLRF